MRRQLRSLSFVFFFNDTATTEIYTLSLHDALPISLTFNCRAYRFQVLEPDAQIVSHVVRSQSQGPKRIQNEAYVGFAQCAYGVYGGRDEALPFRETLKLVKVLTTLLFIERICSET